MNCQECLEELATVSLRSIQPDSAVMQHCATCSDCASLTTRLREREYNVATMLNSLPPFTSPISLAETSATLSRRRRVGRLVVTLSGIAGAIIIAIMLSTMFHPRTIWRGMMRPASSGGLRTETITLSCLSPEQAADIINPYVRSRGSVYYTPASGISVITVRGTAQEIQRSRSLIRGLEGDPAAACRHPMGIDLADIPGNSDEADVTPKLASPDPSPTPAPRPRPVTPARK
jgi:hypothetical protein